MAYSLQLTGNTLPGHDLEKAKADFAKLFNVDDNKKLEKIFSVKKNVTIKKRMTQSDAIHYQEQLNKIGLESVILEPDGTPFVIDEQINSNTSIPNSENQEKNSISNETSSTDYDNEDLEDSVNYASSHQASNGLIWLKEGFNFFKQNPIKWIFALIVWWIAIAIVNIVPVIGQIISLLLSMAMLPGLMYGAYQQDNGNELSIGDTFMAIKKSLSLLVLYIISSVIFVGFGFLIMTSIAASGTSGALPMLILFFIFIFIFIMGFSFSGPLVVLSDVPLIESIKMSFSGCLKNIIPLTIFSILAIILSIVGTLLLGLGLLVATPVIIAGSYAAYRDIFLKA